MTTIEAYSSYAAYCVRLRIRPAHPELWENLSDRFMPWIPGSHPTVQKIRRTALESKPKSAGGAGGKQPDWQRNVGHQHFPLSESERQSAAIIAGKTTAEPGEQKLTDAGRERLAEILTAVVPVPA